MPTQKLAKYKSITDTGEFLYFVTRPVARHDVVAGSSPVEFVKLFFGNDLFIQYLYQTSISQK